MLSSFSLRATAEEPQWQHQHNPTKKMTKKNVTQDENTSRVCFQIGGNTYDYFIEELVCKPEYDGSEYTYLGGSTEVEVRSMRLKFEIVGMKGVMGTEPTGIELWRHLIAGSETVTFYPLGHSGPSTTVIGDIPHTKRSRNKGHIFLTENKWRHPSDAHFVDFSL